MSEDPGLEFPPSGMMDSVTLFFLSFILSVVYLAMLEEGVGGQTWLMGVNGCWGWVSTICG